jgi:hypothetical protein
MWSLSAALLRLNDPDLKGFLDDLAAQLPGPRSDNSLERLLQLPLGRVQQYPSMFQVHHAVCVLA